MHAILGVSLQGIIPLRGSWAREVTTYTDASTFYKALNPGYYSESFDSLSTGAQTEPLLFSANSFSYTLTTGDGNGLFVVTPDSSLPTDFAISPNDLTSVTITFTSGNITAVGGFFFKTDVSGVSQPGTVTVRLADGTTMDVTGTAGVPQPFVGFSSTVPLDSLTIDDPTDGTYPTMNTLTVGKSFATVPEPGTAGLFCTALSSLYLWRRRKKFPFPNHEKTNKLSCPFLS